MKSETWNRLESVFFAALELPPEERSPYLDRACAGDPELRAEVDAVLAAHELAAEEEADPAVLEPDASTQVRGALVGSRVGPYELERLIGRGGMGEVYRARRVDDQYHQDVAVKLIRMGFGADELAARFRVERQVLARLQHPNIATLLDGGVTPNGRSYLVMQHVDGVPITEYADAHRLSIRERLELVRTVCEAVQFAHANLVVHRDLKPINILVTQQGEVRLLDFGIAKLLDPERIGVTAPATGELLLLTPEHAAPEQIQGGQITTATDVYSLGVLLYELLTGSLPFQGLSGRMLQRAVCEKEPTRPSALTLVQSNKSPDAERPDPAVVAELRRTQAESLTKQLRGDLDQIVLMALRKEPARRYASAGQLGEDLSRYLAGRPVIAQPDTLRYRAKKFVRRNRTAAILAAFAALSLVAGLVGTTWQARRARAEATQAAADRDRAELVSSLMVDMFRLSDPSTVLGRSITAREVLDRGAAGIDRDFADQPELQADLFTEVGGVYENLGLFEEAGLHLERALELRRTLFDERDPRVAGSIARVAHVWTDQGRGAEAIPLARDAVDILRDRDNADPPLALAGALLTLGGAQRQSGAPVDASATYAEVIALVEPSAPYDPLVAEAFFGRADAAHSQGRFDDAESLLQETISRFEQLEDGPYPELATSTHNLGMIRMFRRRADEAEPLLRQALDIRREIYGDFHPAVAQTLAGLMQAVALQHRFQDALEIGFEAMAVTDSALGAEHLMAAEVRQGLAFPLQQTGRGEQAVEVLEEANAILRSQLETNHPRMVGNGILIGQAYASLGDLDRARPQFVTTLRRSDEALGPEHPYHAHLLLELAKLDFDRGDFDLSEAEARESLELTSRTLRPDHRFAVWARLQIGRIQAERGQLEAADSLLREVLALQRRDLGDDHPEVARTLVALADLETRLGRPDLAEASVRAALGVLEQNSMDDATLAHARSVLGGALAAQGRVSEAAPLLEESYRVLTTSRGARPSYIRAAQARLQEFERR